MYLDGDSVDQIKYYLETNNIPTKTGKLEWNKGIIRSVLMNERYSGDMLLQKTFVDNCISKKEKKNRGEMPKYLIVNNHPAIIDRQTFKMVQMEINRRTGKRKVADKSITEQGKYSGKYALTELLVCGECGSPYRRRMWTKNGVSKIVWRCLNRVEHGTQFCQKSLSVEENMLKEAVCRALTKGIENRQEVMDLIISNLSYGVTENDEVLNAYAIENQIHTLLQSLGDIASLCSTTEGSTERYEKEIKKLNDQIAALRKELDLVKSKISSDEQTAVEIERIKKLLTEKTGGFSKYDEVTVRKLVEFIKVMPDNKIVVVLKGGLRIEEEL